MPSEFEERLAACKAEVDDAVMNVADRLKNVEDVTLTVHKIYDVVLSLEQRVSNLSLSFASSEAKTNEVHTSLPPEKLRVLQSIVTKAEKRAEMYERLTYKLTESGILGLIIFLLGLLAAGFWQWINARGFR